MSTRKPKRIRYKVSPVKRTGGWQLTSKARHVSEHPTQGDAIARGVKECRAIADAGGFAELMIARPNGQIRDNRTYRGDPRSIKG